MTNLWHQLEPGPDVPDVIYVIVEISKGSRNKYEYGKELGVIKLDRVLFSSLHYPGDYGLIPRTLYDDGDAYAYFKRVPNLFEIITYNY